MDLLLKIIVNIKSIKKTQQNTQSLSFRLGLYSFLIIFVCSYDNILIHIFHPSNFPITHCIEITRNIYNMYTYICIYNSAFHDAGTLRPGFQ